MGAAVCIAVSICGIACAPVPREPLGRGRDQRIVAPHQDVDLVADVAVVDLFAGGGGEARRRPRQATRRPLSPDPLSRLQRRARASRWLAQLSRRGGARFFGLEWAAVAAVVARDRLRDRIRRRRGQRAVARPGARRRLEVGEERLAHLQQRGRIADGRRALAQRRARRTGRANTRPASCAARACASSRGCARRPAPACRRQTARRSSSVGGPGSGAPCSSAASVRNSHGLPIAPRPIITASQPVSRHPHVAGDVLDVAVADHRDVRGSAARTAAIGSMRAAPENPCARVRPCTVIIAAPASTSAHANSGAFSELSSQPARCLTVTGMCAGTARRTAATSSAASAGSRISAEPHAPAVTLFAGQPMLMSTSDAPTSTAMPAARASTSGSRPKIWTPNRRPSKLGHIRPIALAAPRVSASADRNSVKVSAAPSSSHTVRNGRSVTAAIGARRAPGVSWMSPMRMRAARIASALVGVLLLGGAGGRLPQGAAARPAPAAGSGATGGGRRSAARRRRRSVDLAARGRRQQQRDARDREHRPVRTQRAPATPRRRW